MVDPAKNLIALPDDMARIIEARLASGEYETEIDVLRDGLQALDERVRCAEDWVTEEVIPTYNRVVAGIEKTKSASETWDSLNRHIGRFAHMPERLES